MKTGQITRYKNRTDRELATPGALAVGKAVGPLLAFGKKAMTRKFGERR
jgi:hypothetical protein